MKITQTEIADVLIIEPTLFSDPRGFFFESFNLRAFTAVANVEPNFVQDNHSKSARHVLRGLHYQVKQPQGKLVRVVAGEVFDVAVDIRPDSPTFGRWVGHVLSAENRKQLWIPPGLAHGFLVLSESAEFLYKATDYWSPQHERCIRWDDPQLAIAWPLNDAPVVSAKDAAGLALAQAELPDQGARVSQTLDRFCQPQRMTRLKRNDPAGVV